MANRYRDMLVFASKTETPIVGDEVNELILLLSMLATCTDHGSAVIFSCHVPYRRGEVFIAYYIKDEPMRLFVLKNRMRAIHSLFKHRS